MPVEDSVNGLVSAPVSEDSLIWSGFFFRSKQRKVGVDAYLVAGQFALRHSQHSINIAYRAPFPEDAYVLAVLVFEAENCTQQTAFNEYIKYFLCKARTGFVPLAPHVALHVVPYSEAALTVYPELRPYQLLGLVVAN